MTIHEQMLYMAKARNHILDRVNKAPVTICRVKEAVQSWCDKYPNPELTFSISPKVFDGRLIDFWKPTRTPVRVELDWPQQLDGKVVIIVPGWFE